MKENALFVTISWLAKRGSVCYDKLAREAWHRLLEKRIESEFTGKKEKIK